MNTIKITKRQACRFLVSYHGLTGKHMYTGKQGILDFIGKVGCIQFDPLNIVGHNHELVLQSRIRGFKPEMLRELLYEERKLIDGWDKNMSIYLTEDWPYFKRMREAAKQKLGTNDKTISRVLPQVRREIEARGPLSSIDLEYNETVDWFWAPARVSRAALESMYFWGELIIHHKVHTRRIYDFAVRNLPEKLLSASDPNVTEEEYFAWHVLRRIASIGMLWNKAGDVWLGIEGMKSRERSKAFETLLAEGRIMEIEVQDVKYPVYIKSEDKKLLDSIIEGRQAVKRASILAPLDNLLWDRKLILELFGFDYRWEVYKPVKERSYGYYVLPVLYGDRFAARFEPGWDKSTNTLIIKNWWWEPGIKQDKRLKEQLRKCFVEFLQFLKAEGVRDESKDGIDLNGLIKETKEL